MTPSHGAATTQCQGAPHSPHAVLLCLLFLLGCRRTQHTPVWIQEGVGVGEPENEMQPASNSPMLLHQPDAGTNLSHGAAATQAQGLPLP